MSLLKKAQAKKAAAKGKESKKPTGPVIKLAPKKAATPPKMLAKKNDSPTEGLSPVERIEYVMSTVNSQFGGEVIRRANEANTSYTLRRPTGICGLDIGIGGGYPAGALSLLTGPDGAGKDYIMNCAIREVQKNYGEESRIAILSTEFPYDKKFARDQAGVEVGMTGEEIDDLIRNRARAGAPPLTDEEIAVYQNQIGEIVLIQGLLMDHALDVFLNLLDTGAFQLMMINSLGVMETVAKDDTESLEEHAIQSSEAQLLSRFIPKMFMYQNRPMRGGGRNETTILAANQVRANRSMPRMKPGVPIPDYMKYQPGSGSRALAHGKAIDVMLHKGADILDKTVEPHVAVGRTINWELVKGKLGTHDGIEGSYDYFFSEGVDLAMALLPQAVLYGVIEQSGAWYSFDDGETSFNVQGAPKAAEKLRENRDFYDYIYRRTVAAAGIYCRYT